jgi:hypothetical protein
MYGISSYIMFSMSLQSFGIWMTLLYYFSTVTKKSASFWVSRIVKDCLSKSFMFHLIKRSLVFITHTIGSWLQQEEKHNEDNMNTIHLRNSP